MTRSEQGRGLHWQLASQQMPQKERPLDPHPHLTWPEVLWGPVLLPLLGRLWFLVLVESTKHRGSTSHLVEREKRSNSEGDIR